MSAESTQLNSGLPEVLTEVPDLCVVADSATHYTSLVSFWTKPEGTEVMSKAF